MSKEQHDRLSIYEESTKKYIDAIKAVLILQSNFDLLPEVYDIFGKEGTIKFLNIFAGRVIRIPTREEIDTAIRDVMLWVAVSKNGSVDSIRALSAKYGVTKNEVVRIHGRVKDLMARYKVSLKDVSL